MADINLLPQDKAARPSVVKTSSVVKQILTVGLIIFILTAVGIAGFYVYFSRELRASQEIVSELSANIKALEVTETRLLLVKERLEKAKLVLGVDSSIDEIESLQSLILTFPEGVAVSEARIQKEATQMTFSSPNTTSLTLVLKGLKETDLYSSVDMTSFSFTPETGFNVGLKLVR